MASNLFNAAAKALSDAIGRKLANTSLGRILQDVDTDVRRGTFGDRERRILRAKLQSMTTQQVADEILRQLANEQPGAIRSAVSKAFGRGGPLGKLIGKLLNPDKATERVDRDREIEAAANIANLRLKPLPGWKQFRDREVGQPGEIVDDEMIPVKSSNVHSIGFRMGRPGPNQTQSSKGTLLIRFLGTAPDGHRAGPGPMYEYFDVPSRVFLAFKRAASKGKFVWDNVRVRGTVSGHRFVYDLAEISQGYVPRQAGLKRGHTGEWYLTRKFRDRTTGKLHTSQLPEQKVRDGGPNRGVRGSDLRGGPNRGR